MPAPIFSAIITAPFGKIGVCVQEGLLAELVYLPPDTAERAPSNKLAGLAARQLTRYLADPDYRFDLPLAPVGTPYQQRVWQAIAAIPRGQVRSYGALARMLHSMPRPIGQACGANRFPIVIPCHRVVASSGLGGFAHTSSTLDPDNFLIAAKRWLLRHEGVRLPDARPANSERQSGA